MKIKFVYSNTVFSKIVLLVIAFTLLLTISQQSAYCQLFNDKTGKEHEVLQKFIGNWYQLAAYTTMDGKVTNAKGSIKGEVVLGGSILKLQSGQTNTISINENLIIIGYDSNLKKYFFQAFDREGNLPSTYLGAYDKNSKKFQFETFMLDENGNKLLSVLELWFERDDKFIYKVTVKESDKQTVIAEVANVKVIEEKIQENYEKPKKKK